MDYNTKTRVIIFHFLCYINVFSSRCILRSSAVPADGLVYPHEGLAF